MRILVDEEHLGWNKAFDIICKIFSFTTHTVFAEALEKIPVDLLESLLPRHLQVCPDTSLLIISLILFSFVLVHLKVTDKSCFRVSKASRPC